MKTLAAQAALIFCLLCVPAQVALSQPSSSVDFGDLAARAQAALDSKPAEAADLYRQALALKPDWTEGWFYLGGALYQLDRYPEAVDAFRKTVALSPKHGTAWAFLGLCEAELDNSEQALADIRKGEALGLGDNQDFVIAVRVKAARLLIQASGFDEALAELQPLVLLNTNAPAVVDTMGLCALATPSKLSDLSSERRKVVNLAGKAAWGLVVHRPSEAAAGYKALLEQYPNEAGVHYAYGLYLLETDASAALAEFQKELQGNPKHWPSLFVVASLQLRDGASDKSVETLRSAMKIIPSRFRWFCHAELGRAYLGANNLDTAITELKTAARLRPASPQVHFFLAQAYRRAGKAEDAQRETAEFQKLKVLQDPLGVTTMRTFSNVGTN
jgi:tetratricopeptide (TPR) repeat protein